ncbi:MAG: MTH1187 family thiamine-binding protein [Thermodesulfobacteriota bacterium]|nr:MAG: MTH1187 family thiamine-binding protein [Thermodesulfobacteriota bacterium]
MLAEFSIVPVGKAESVGETVARILRVVDASGMPYKANAMGTIVEGEWDAVMGLIKKCHEEAAGSAPRLLSHITIDLRPSKPLDRLEEKLKSVEKRLGKELKK